MKQRIREWLMGNQLDQLWSTQSSQDKRLADLQKILERLASTHEDQSREVLRAIQMLVGLLNYLDVEAKTDLEPDPNYFKPEQKMREIIKIYKKRK